MKFIPNNVFEAFKFSIFLNKLIGYIHFSFAKDKLGNFKCVLTVFDKIWFLLSVLLSVWTFYEVGRAPMNRTGRSFIIDINVFMSQKLLACQPLLVVLSNFNNRRDFAQILIYFDWIDTKVSKCCVYLDFNVFRLFVLYSSRK